MAATKTNGLSIAVLVSGRGTNLQSLLDAQAAGVIHSRIVSVISNRENAQALERAKKVGVSTQCIPSRGKSNQDFFLELGKALQEINPDLIVLAGFMKILPADLIQSYTGQIINIHPSLLPLFPGLNAQEQALNAGVKVTGCTVHFVDVGCDTGPIILQKTEPIFDNDTVATLSKRLLAKEHAALVEAVTLIENDKVILQGHRTLLRL